MAIRNIIQEGDPTLRKKSFEVTDFGEKTHQLLDDMKQTLRHVEGAGLAAPQVGVLRRLFIVDIDQGYFEFLNPVILSQSGSKIEDEGCLSVKDSNGKCKYGKVARPTKVKVRALDRYGKPFVLNATGLLAKAICHEYDHLDGILFIDKAFDMWEEK